MTVLSGTFAFLAGGSAVAAVVALQDAERAAALRCGVMAAAGLALAVLTGVLA